VVLRGASAAQSEPSSEKKREHTSAVMWSRYLGVVEGRRRKLKGKDEPAQPSIP
jgi:hypothetical protein